MRERMFLVAYRKELDIANPSFPKPTHCHQLPPGYEGSRQVALRLLNGLFAGAHDYVEPPATSGATRPAVTAFEAIGDLRSEEHTSELHSLMRISYAVFCLKKKQRDDKRHTIPMQSTYDGQGDATTN